jgi:manganese-dependent ADP-ribose/CDP-alcohol diphosphatase
MLAAAQTGSGSEATDRCIFRFGVIADIQYSDIETASNFLGTEQRNYRGVLVQVKRAVSLWNSLSPRPIFVAQLGDLIDGQNAGQYGSGLGMAAPQSQSALDSVTGLLAECAVPSIYHTIGNHELYNYKWADLKLHLDKPELGWFVPGQREMEPHVLARRNPDRTPFRLWPTLPCLPPAAC